MENERAQRGSRPAWLVMAALALPFLVGAGVSAVHQVEDAPAAHAPAADVPAAVVSWRADGLGPRSGLAG